MTLLRLAAGDPIPEGCDQLVEVGTTGRATVVGLNDSETGTTVRITAVAECVADAVSRRLAPLVDLVDGAGTPSPPREVKLADLVGPVTPATVRRRWEASDGAPRTPIAVGSQGPIEVDLVADGPHALVAGTTGSGKSAFLQALVLGVATHASPDDIAFVLADYKGGATFDACAELPHVANQTLEAVRLPYADGAFAFTVLAPQPGSGQSVDDLLAGLDADSFAALQQELSLIHI